MFFKTERLVARKLTIDDIITFDEMQKNEKVMKYIIGRPKTNEENINELEKIISSYEIINSEFLIMAVVKKEVNQFVGTCAIVENEHGEHEIGYRFIEEYWGNGYGKEILNGLVIFAMKSLQLNCLVAYVNKDNYASVKILDSSDFNFIKEFDEYETGEVIRYYKKMI